MICVRKKNVCLRVESFFSEFFFCLMFHPQRVVSPENNLMIKRRSSQITGPLGLLESNISIPNGGSVAMCPAALCFCSISL